ncbi:hypothetical protein FA13DRAFT_1754203 [Coprinellus micaceus]|uniref:DUF4470 domain-containing protein n=1 Tax=Coprinellus micaceus TaxID=71717 RepID=A0A4Y7TFY8_COPMI|nr:hypothetical protein FA13DRAFT_1754203 [Coprinellus micaceus]
MSYGLGSGPGGATLSELGCYNDRAEGGPCASSALLACAQPHWIKEHRVPSFCITPSESKNPNLNGVTGNRLWGHFPAYDVLQLPHNEGLTAGTYQDFKLCFTAASDIRNVVQTINNLPRSYQGTCDILLNEQDTISANRNLVILYRPELAVHLMYSSRLTSSMAAYLQRCVHMIYGDAPRGVDMIFQRTFPTRGRGRLSSAQPAMAIKHPVEMFLSRCDASRAMRRMKDVLFDPARLDERHRLLAALEPPHRLAHIYLWKTGVLAPFSLDLSSFNQPNRLAFTPQGSWLGKRSDLSPLHGWDVTRVRASGLKNGIDPAGDIFGSLFFHIKQELKEFITRIKDFDINIHHTQYDPRLLSKGVTIGVLPSFTNAMFDRIDIGDMGDKFGVAECIEDWGALLDKRNPHSCILAHSVSWIDSRPSPSRSFSSPEKVLEPLKWKCRNIPSLGQRLKAMLQQGSYSPPVLRLIESLDAFVDSGPSFQEFLASRKVYSTCLSVGLHQRERHNVHPKRFGIPLDAPSQALPDVSKEEYYNLLTTGGADLTTRFMEFEVAA